MEAKDDTRALVLGTLLGVVGGFVLGSMVAFGIAPHWADVSRRLPFRRQPRLRFDVFLQ